MGKLYTKIEADGNGFNLSNAKLNINLTDTNILLGDSWVKNAGESASITGKFRRLDDNGFIFENISMSAPGLTIAGGFDLAEDLRLKEVIELVH